MRIVVTGGNGNIGSHIIQELLKLGGHEIISFSRSSKSIHPKTVQYVRGDRHDTSSFVQKMRDLKPDIVFEMTCFTAADARISIEAFSGVKQLITASTVCTYGKGFNHFPIREEDEFSPWTPYGIEKHEADCTFLDAYRTERFPVTIMKPGITYSELSGMLRCIGTEHTWIDRMMKGKPILICGEGNTIQQFLHAEDAARGFIGVMGKSKSIGQTYNVTQTGSTTWLEYYHTAMKILGRKVELIGVPVADLMKIDAQRFALCNEIFSHHSYLSTQKLRCVVPEWRPRISLEKGLERVFAYMKRNHTIPNSDLVTWEDEIISAVQAKRS